MFHATAEYGQLTETDSDEDNSILAWCIAILKSNNADAVAERICQCFACSGRDDNHLTCLRHRLETILGSLYST